MEWELAKKQALNILRRRSIHSSELFKKLKEKGHSKEVIEKVIAYCVSCHFLDDAAYAESLANQKKRALYGPRRLQETFKSKGIPSDVVFTDEEERNSIKKLIEKKMRTQPPEKYPSMKLWKNALYGMLFRRGFSYEAIYQTLGDIEDR